ARPPTAVEVLEGSAHPEVARRADVAAPETAGEEPVRGPAAEPALLRQPLDHGLARRRRQRVEVEPTGDDGPREVADVLALAARELHRAELPQPRLREGRAVGERPDGVEAERQRRRAPPRVPGPARDSRRARQLPR